MNQALDMKVNRLPSRTWNWLHMNEAVIDQVMVEDENNVTITLPENISQGNLSGTDFEKIATGMGEDRGTIDFVKGCAGSKGNEKEDVLLLDDDVKNQTIPVILCAEEDVEGNHGATIGQLDEELLFYLRSRELSEEYIYEMLAKAGIDAVCSKIPDMQIREAIAHYFEGGETDEQ